MVWVVVASVLLQLYFAVTCSMWWAAVAERDLLFAARAADELLLHWLAVAKVVAAPVSLILLAARPRWGRWFTGAMFIAYGVGGLAMPLLSGDYRPMAWWPNARAAGEGPLVSLVFLGLGIALLMHARIMRTSSLPAEPGPPVSPGTP